MAHNIYAVCGIAQALGKGVYIPYCTAWTTSHKNPQNNGEKGSLYMLNNTMEADDSFFKAAHAGIRRGRDIDKPLVVFDLPLDAKYLIT